jgi:predicted acylesterase/phospholipase RssA
MIAIVLSGGFALGSFEVGAVRYLYNIGIRPDIICGTSVGAINGAKLAEGEGTDPNTSEPTGLAGLEKIWLERLKQNSDVYVQGPFLNWLQQNSPELYQQFIDAGLIVPDPDPAPDSAVVTGTTSWVASAGAAISTAGHFINLAVTYALGNLPQLSISLFDQQPILNLIIQHLNLQLIYNWANKGGQLRFATVGLLSGKVRYATQNGQLLERDNSLVATLPPYQPLPAACQPQANYLAGLENQLSALNANRPSPDDPNYQGWLSDVQALNSQINDAQLAVQQCKDANHAPHIPGLVQAINASLALPTFLIPETFDGEMYVDGGIRDVMPVAKAAELGASEIYAVNDSPPLSAVNSDSVSNALDVALRALTGIAVDEVAYEAAHSVESSSAVKVTLIQSTFSLPNDAYTIHPALIRINMSYGYMRAADAVNPSRIRPNRSRQLAEDITALRRILFQFERIAAGPDLSFNLPMLRWAKGILALLINERFSLGGPIPSPDVTSAPGNWEMHFPWSPPGATPFDAIGPVPAADPASFVPGNNTLLQERQPVNAGGPAPINTIYIVLGGAGFAIPNAQELALLGLQNAPIQAVPAGAQFPPGAQNPVELHTTQYLPSIPLEGTLIKERDSASVFLIKGGKKCFVSDTVFRLKKFKSAAVLVAPSGGLASIPRGPNLVASIEPFIAPLLTS